MKKSTIRLLVLALLAVVFMGLLASCNGGNDDTYTVKMYDGETLLKELTFEKGATFAYTNADIAKAGYEVEGIYTDAAMTEEYKADDGSTPVVSSDLSLYVKFEPKQFYLFIDYNDNGVTEDIEQEVTYNTAYTLAAPAERIGYRFIGFERKVNKVWQEFPATGTYNFTDDIEIRIRWEKIEYVTVLDLTGAEVDKFEIAADGSVTLPNVADTADKYFGGYTVDGTAFGEKQQDGSYKATGLTGSVTALQKWTAIPTYTLTVDGLYGNDVVPPLTKKEGESFDLTLPTAPTNAGFAFVRYELNGQPLTLGQGGTVTLTLTDNTVITTVWRKLVYITIFDGITQIGQPIEVAENGSFTLPAVADTADNTFEGYLWNEQPFGALQQDGTYTGTYSGSVSINVFYKWEGIDRTYINVVSKGSSYAFAPVEVVGGAYKPFVVDPAYIGDAPSSGYFFIGFYTDEACTQPFANDGTYADTADLTVYALFRRQITVSIYTPDGSFITSVKTDKDGNFTLPRVEDGDRYFRGYTIAGITLSPADEDDDNGPYTGNYTGDSDLAAYQKWEAIPSFDIFFNAMGGAFAEGEGGKLTVKETDGTITLPIPTLADYTFVGWLSAGQLIGTYENGVYTLSYSDWSKTDALTLTAKWEAARQTGEQKDANGNSLNYFVEINNGKYTYILLTGHTYTFGTASSTVTLGAGGDTYVTNKVQNGFTVGTNAGAFSMTISDPAKGEVTIDVIVKNYISSIGHGSSTADVYGSGYLGNFRDYDKETNPKKPLSVGTANAFRPDLSFATNGGASLSMGQLMGDIEYTLEIVGVTLAEGVSPNDFVEITATKDGFKFTFDEILKNHEVILTILPKYALKYVSADRQVAPLTMRIVLNEGVNVHTNEELYDAFFNTEIHEINVQRNITAAVNPAHGYDGDVTDPMNDENHAVYYRSVSGADRITVNGNYFKIDASKIPLMNPCDSNKPGSQLRGFSQVDDVPTGYLIANMQFGIFAYRNESTTGANSGEQFMTMNDLFISGNNIPFNDMDNPEGVYKPEDYGKEFIPLSGSSLGIVFRRTSGTVNNCIVKNTCLAYYATGSTELNPTKLWADVTLNKCVADQNWGNSMYAYGQVHYTLDNVYFGASGGPSIHFDDSATALNPYANPASYELNPATLAVTSKLAISDTSEFNNYRTGTEAWFRAFGFNAVIPTIKPMFGDSYTVTTENKETVTMPGIVPSINAGRKQALEINKDLGALPFTEITPTKVMKEQKNNKGETDEVFNFIFVTKTSAGNFTAGTDNCDYFCKPYVQLTRISGGVETPIEPHAFANTANAALGKNLLPIYACFDSKFYTEREIMAGMSVGFLIGLYE